MSSHAIMVLFLFVTMYPTSSFLMSSPFVPRGPSFKMALENDDNEPTQVTIMQEWQDYRNMALSNTRKLCSGRVKALDKREKQIRENIRDSIEELRDNLLASSTDYEVRTTVNDHFVQTSRALGKELHDLCKEMDTKIKDISPQEELVGKLDKLFVEISLNMGYQSNLQDIKSELATTVPVYNQIFEMVDKMCCEPDMQEGGETTATLQPKIQESLDRFQRKVEDRLLDLRNDMRFQIRIMEDQRNSET